MAGVQLQNGHRRTPYTENDVERPMPCTDPAPLPQQLLTVQHAADRLSLSRSKTYQLIATGRLPAVKIDGSTRIVGHQLDAFIESLMDQGGRRQDALGRSE
jgi:excisionase family DNA binding protein